MTAAPEAEPSPTELDAAPAVARRPTAIPYVVGLWALVLGYVALLQVGYIYAIEPTYAYLGFHYRSPEPEHYTIAIVMVLAVATLLPQAIQQVSDLILWLMFIVTVAPSVLIAQYNPLLPPGQGLVLGANLCVCLLLTRALAALRPRMYLDIAAVQLRRVFPLIGVAAAVGVLGYLVATNGLSLRLVSLNEVYARRRDFFSTESGLSAYLAPAFFNVVGPALMALGLYRRRYLMFWGAAGVQFLLYLSVAYKTILFAIPIIYLLHRVLRSGRTLSGSDALKAVVIGGVAALGLDRLLHGTFFTDLFVRRFLYFPGLISSVYVSIFTKIGHTNFFEVVPGVHSGASVAGTPALVVGHVFYGGAVNANASLWMHGYASYGYLGMYLETLVFIVLLWIADDCSHGLPFVLAASIFIMPGLAMAETSVFTAILTHGFLCAFVVAIIVPRPTPDDEPVPVATPEPTVS